MKSLDERLFDAIVHGDLDAVREAIDAGAEVNAQDEAGWTPLDRACLYGHVPIVRFLLSHGADVNARDAAGQTPLHSAMDMSPGDTREEILDLFRQYAPESVMEAYCSPGPGGMKTG